MKAPEEDPPVERVVHATRIHGDHGKVFAQCRCGWKSPFYAHMGMDLAGVAKQHRDHPEGDQEQEAAAA